MTEIAPHDPEGDATYLFNTNRHMPIEAQKFIAQNTLDFLNSTQASIEYAPNEIAYMRGVWTRVKKKVQALEEARSALA